MARQVRKVPTFVTQPTGVVLCNICCNTIPMKPVAGYGYIIAPIEDGPNEIEVGAPLGEVCNDCYSTHIRPLFHIPPRGEVEISD